MTDRPDPARDFKAASDRFQQAIAAAAEKTTEAEAEATLSAAIEDYNRAVDTYNAHAEQYNREHGLTEDDDEAETLRYLVRNGDTATLEAKPSWPDERDGALAELTAELESANANAAEIADQRTAYRKEIMRLRARVRELEGAQAADDTTRVDALRHTDDTPDAERLAQIRDRNRRLAAVPFETHGGGHGPGCIPCELVRAIGDVGWLLEQLNAKNVEPHHGITEDSWCDLLSEPLGVPATIVLGDMRPIDGGLYAGAAIDSVDWGVGESRRQVTRISIPIIFPDHYVTGPTPENEARRQQLLAELDVMEADRRAAEQQPEDGNRG